MNSRYKRIELLELALPQEEELSTSWEEFTNLHFLQQNFLQIWPDPTAAPTFLQEENRRWLEFARRYKERMTRESTE